MYWVYGVIPIFETKQQLMGDVSSYNITLLFTLSLCYLPYCFAGRIAGSTCFGTGQCVVNSECSSTMGGTCDCRSGYYESGGICVEGMVFLHALCFVCGMYVWHVVFV